MFKFPNIFEDFIRQMNESLLKSATQPLHDEINKLTQQLKTNFELPKIDAPRIAENFIKESTRGIQESIARLNPILAKAAEAMGERGWWLIRQLPITFYRDVEELSGEDITESIVYFFSRNEWEPLTKLVNAWNVPEFSSRSRYFQDALEAHKQGFYTMTVPGLVIHVEGIIREFMQVTEGFTHRSFAQVNSLFRNKFRELQTVPDNRQITFEDVQLIENYYNLAVLRRLYENYDPNAHQDPESVNRHAVGHGLWINYGTQEESLYLFLLLDMLHAMLEQLARESQELTDEE